MSADDFLPDGFTYVREVDGNPVGITPRPHVYNDHADLLFRIVRIWQERQTLAEQLFAATLSSRYDDGRYAGARDEGRRIVSEIRDFADDLYGITGARWIADALTSTLDRLSEDGDR